MTAPIWHTRGTQTSLPGRERWNPYSELRNTDGYAKLSPTTIPTERLSKEDAAAFRDLDRKMAEDAEARRPISMTGNPPLRLADIQKQIAAAKDAKPTSTTRAAETRVVKGGPVSLSSRRLVDVTRRPK